MSHVAASSLSSLLLQTHLACARLYENGEITPEAWDRARAVHEETGRDLLRILIDMSELDAQRVKQLCPGWVEAPEAVRGTRTDDLVRDNPSPFSNRGR